MMTEFPHLYPAARQLAALGAEERIHRIRADRWISYPRAEAALVKPKDPLEYVRKLRFHAQVKATSEYGLDKIE